MQPKPKALIRALALTGLCLGLPSLAFAVPMQLNHQGRLVDSSGIGLDGTGHTLTFSVYDDLTGGTAVWTETLSVTFTNGFYSAVLGTDEVSNPLDTTLFSTYPIYLEVTVNTDPPLSPRQELVSVPYAILAETAASVDGGSVNATDVSINSLAVINAQGEWVGVTPDVGWSDLTGIPGGFSDNIDDDTLASLGCGNAEYPVYDTGSSSWGCTTITDSTLTETEVDNFVDNNGYLTLGDLASVATSGDYNDLINTPLDDDTLAALGCVTGEYPMWDGAMWTCVVPPDT